MKFTLVIMMLVLPLIVEASALAPILSPRIIGVVTTNQDGRGNQFRATLERMGGEDNRNLRLIIEQINYARGGAGSVWARFIIYPQDMMFGKDTVISNLSLSDDGFIFSQTSAAVVSPTYTCDFVLPPEPISGVQILNIKALTCGVGR